MRFRHVTLMVKDLDASIKFYEDMAGLALERRFEAGPGMEIAFLGSGETEIELVRGGTVPPEGAVPGVGISIGFEAESLEDKIGQLRKNGYETDGVIERPNPSVGYFFTYDPDGYRVQFING